jgi:uncharacterized membrane protein
MKRSQRAFWGWLGRKLRAQFFTGVIAVVPIAITILVLVWLFTTIDGVLQPIITNMFGFMIPGAGFGITIVLIYLAGIIASNVVGRRVIRYGESVLPGIPVVRQFYQGIKQILESFSAPKTTGFMQVVFTEFPRKGMRVIGFITNKLSDEPGKEVFTVFIPTSPNPTSGFLQIVEENEIVRTDISVEAALRMVVSAGRVLPDEVSSQLSADS